MILNGEGMKRAILLFFLLIIPLFCFAQKHGCGGKSDKTRLLIYYNEAMSSIHKDILAIKNDYEELKSFDDGVFYHVGLCPKREGKFIYSGCNDHTTLLSINWTRNDLEDIETTGTDNNNSKINIFFQKKDVPLESEPKEKIFLPKTDIYLICQLELKDSGLEKQIIEIVRKNGRLIE